MKEIDLGFTVVQLYEKFGVSHIKDDVVLDYEKSRVLLQTFIDHYGEKPFVYLSQRKNNYNVNPTIYYNLNEGNGLLGIGIACEHPERSVIAKFEKKFCKFPFEIFYNLEDAKKWAEGLYEKKKAGL